jgi:hypothetical protein
LAATACFFLNVPPSFWKWDQYLPSTLPQFSRLPAILDLNGILQISPDPEEGEEGEQPIFRGLHVATLSVSVSPGKTGSVTG